LAIAHLSFFTLLSVSTERQRVFAALVARSLPDTLQEILVEAATSGIKV
jgi:hypothetical protein